MKALNLFHILFVASLLCILAKRLDKQYLLLKIFTYITVLLMVIYHAYKLFSK